MHTALPPHIYDNVVYRKAPRPPAAYSPDIRVVADNCRADGGEEDAIALLQTIFSIGISEQALIRKLTREEARQHHSRAPTQVYRILLRNDEAGSSHCRLCTAGANENGWKNARDVLRHLKRDHFGLVDVCERWSVQAHVSIDTSKTYLEGTNGKTAYTTSEMSRHR